MWDKRWYAKMFDFNYRNNKLLQFCSHLIQEHQINTGESRLLIKFKNTFNIV